MITKRIRMTHAYSKTPPNVSIDFDWIRRNEKALLEKYGECSVIVYKEQVLGTGPTYEAALEDAERNLPSGVTEVTPVQDYIHSRQPFYRVYPPSIRESH